MKNSKGCAYGLVTRQITSEVRTDIKEIKKSMENIDKKVNEMFNHMNDKIEKVQNRLPLWAVLLITILSNLFVGAAVALFRITW